MLQFNSTERSAVQKLLSDFEQLCTTNGIQFFLLGGSLLGYAKNGDIIPWDEDIDLGILLQDVDKIKGAVENSVIKLHYHFLNYSRLELFKVVF